MASKRKPRTRLSADEIDALVYKTLDKLAGDERRVQVSYSTLEDMIDLNRMTIRTAVLRLQAAGRLDYVPGKRHGSKGANPNVYELVNGEPVDWQAHAERLQERIDPVSEVG
jgi:hypothetical protein